MKILIGANSNLTESLCRSFQDSQVVVVGRNKPDYIASINDKKIIFLKTDYKETDQLVGELQNYDNLQVIFVGIGSAPKLVIDLNHEQIADEANKNIVFAVSLVSRLLPKMLKEEFGRYIFIGSTESDKGVTGGAIYAIIKKSLEALSKNLAIEYGKFNISSKRLFPHWLTPGPISKVYLVFFLTSVVLLVYLSNKLTVILLWKLSMFLKSKL
jgi:NAD(P)-dependent dehydrogenase (short-subunit alcohol dehydrogenase family)